MCSLDILCTIAGIQLGAFPEAGRPSSLAKLSEADKNASTGTEAGDLIKATEGDGIQLAKGDAAVLSIPTVVVMPSIPVLPKKKAGTEDPQQ